MRISTACRESGLGTGFPASSETYADARRGMDPARKRGRLATGATAKSDSHYERQGGTGTNCKSSGR